MASSYTDSLRLTLPLTGELDGSWGTTVNTGITELVDAAIAGTATVVHSNAADYSLTSNSGATDESRQMFLNITGTLTAARNVVCPTKSKLYFIKNSTTGGYAITLKTAAGTGIAVANGALMVLRCDGVNVVEAVTTFLTPALGTPSAVVLTNGTGLPAAGVTGTALVATDKDASGGVAGLTLFKLNLKNAAGTFTNFFTNATTAARTWTLPDKDGTVAMTSDISGAGSFTSVTDSGDLTFTGTGNRIRGEFSSTTVANRVAFQTSTVDGTTTINIIPNGTALVSSLQLLNDAGATNAGRFAITCTGTAAQLNSAQTGSGAYLPLEFYTGGALRFTISTAGAITIPGTLGVTGVITATAGIAVEAVVAPTFVNSWANSGGVYTTAAYYKDAQNVVRLRGTINTGASGSIAFTLPSGYRPPAYVSFAVLAGTGFGYVQVNSVGEVIVTRGAASEISLDGVSFRVA